MMASAVADGNQDRERLTLKGADPETCMIVFQNHWTHVVKILDKHDPLRGSGAGLAFGPIPGDEACTVQNYVEHMLFLLMEEGSGHAGAMGPILEFVVTENVMERLFVWSLRREFTDDRKLEQLRMYDTLLRGARQPLLHHKPVLRPLMMLLGSCAAAGSPAVEGQLVLLLGRLCSVLARDPSALELFFHASGDQGAANFLIFSLLVPFVHRGGAVGRRARDSLLFIVALSAENQLVARHVVESTYFCPVLATGLSGLYSSLPTKMEVGTDDWPCLEKDDWLSVPPLAQFLNSLEFCNAVVQVAHPVVRSQLLSYIYSGFLVPVLAPALHKLTLEELATTTAYLDLFLRHITEPTLQRTFLTFVMLHQHEGVHLLDTLVSRINTPFQLGTVSLALFRTLTALYCEDVMLQLILRYLVPCSHLMPGQHEALKERDCCSVSAARFLSLIPACCLPEPRSLSPALQDLTVQSKAVDNQHKADSDSIVAWPKVFMDASYLQYLHDARNGIDGCSEACLVWSAPYNGQDPAPELYLACGDDEEGGGLDEQMESIPQLSGPSSVAGSRTSHMELEWDDSFDAVPRLDDSEGIPANGHPVPVEPPKHLQEMKKNVNLLIKGSYVEESEFQDDVMVYSLVAQKDCQEVVDYRVLKVWRTGPSPPTPGTEDIQGQECSSKPMVNGFSSPQSTMETKEQNHFCYCIKSKQTDSNSNLNMFSQPGDDLALQYEELLRALGVEPGSPVKPKKDFLSPFSPAEEEEVDFSFSADSMELEKTPSPPGSKSRRSCQGHGTPFTGPFFSVLLSRLENMLENSLHANLLLTGILAQLAMYPQPLLRSFLLDTSVAFQPGVRSLYQVLSSLKLQIERRASSKQDFLDHVTDAQKYLLARDEATRNQDASLDPYSGEDGTWYPGENEGGAQPFPSRDVGGMPPPPQIPPQARDAAFATVLYAEFLQELAAISQEHSIPSHLSLDD